MSEKITPPVFPEGRKNLFYSDYSKFLGFLVIPYGISDDYSPQYSFL